MADDVRAVLSGEKRWACVQADCVAFLDSLPESSVDLVFASPPYLDARTYGIDAVYDCEGWVDWMLRVSEAAIRVSKGLVLWVVSGVQRDNCYWPGCEGLMWEWWKRGNKLWRPCIWWKVDEEEGGSGIPGSGGKQWLRNDWEYVIAFKRDGWLPWADNTAMGHEPVYSRLGGAMSNRTQDGQRINQHVGERLADGRLEEWGDDPWKTKSRGGSGCGGRRKNGKKMAGPTRRANGEYKHVARDDGEKLMYTRDADGSRDAERGEVYGPPKVANPGNCVIVKARVGGGHMGNKLCHENEAPFPEDLATFFVLSFCPPGGLLLDCFSGSGTTSAVAVRHGRRALACDLRESQVSLTRRRVSGETPDMFVKVEATP